MHVPRWLCLIVLAAVIPVFAAPCPSYPAGSWKKDQPSALRFEQSWLEALNQKNIAALDCMLDDSFKDTSMKGALRPKTQVLKELPFRSDQWQQKLTNMEAQLFGNTAVVHGVDQVSDQQGHEVMRIRFTDVLHYMNKRWVAVAAQETAEAPH